MFKIKCKNSKKFLIPYLSGNLFGERVGGIKWTVWDAQNRKNTGLETKRPTSYRIKNRKIRKYWTSDKKTGRAD